MIVLRVRILGCNFRILSSFGFLGTRAIYHDRRKSMPIWPDLGRSGESAIKSDSIWGRKYWGVISQF